MLAPPAPIPHEGFTVADEAVLEPRRVAGLFPWFYGWNVLAVAVAVVAMAVGIVVSSFSFFALHWMAEFGTSRGETMLVLSATQIAAGFMLPFTGRAMDRFSMRWIGVAGVLCLCAGLALSTLATALWHLLLIFGLVVAAAEALIGQIFAQTLAAKWFRTRRGLALGLASLGTSVGAFIFPVLIAFMLSDMPWRSVMLILAAGVAAIAIPALLLVIRNAPAPDSEQPQQTTAAAAAAAAADSEWTTWKVLKSPIFWFIVLGFLPLFEATAGLTSNLGPYTQDLGISTQGAGFLMSIWSITVILGKIAFGLLADRFEQRVLYYLSWFPTLIGLILLQMEPGYPMMVAIMIILGLGSGSNLPLIGIMISRNFGAAAFGTVMGLFYLCLRPVSLAAPIAGWVRDTFGSYDWFWIGVMILAIVAAPGIYFVKERVPR
jgi:MFS family permease